MPAAAKLAPMLAPVPPQLQNLVNYLPLHTALETLAIAVAGMIFATIWSVRREQLRPGMMMLGCGLFALLVLARGVASGGGSRQP